VRVPPPLLCLLLYRLKKRLPPSLPFESRSVSKALVHYMYRATTHRIQYVWKCCS